MLEPQNVADWLLLVVTVMFVLYVLLGGHALTEECVNLKHRRTQVNPLVPLVQLPIDPAGQHDIEGGTGVVSVEEQVAHGELPQSPRDRYSSSDELTSSSR